MIIHKNVRIYISVLLLVFLADSTNCDHRELVIFTQETVAELTLSKDPTTAVHFACDEEKQKLCYYAKMAADLAYVNCDNRFVPQWHNTIEASEFSLGMACATLPAVYILRWPWDNILELTFIEHAAHHLKFDQKIIVGKSVNPTKERNTSKDSEWIKLSAESREYLCNAAREYVSPLHFLHHEVAAAQTYKFEDLAGVTETHDAFLCPTIPRLFLRPGNTEKEVQIVHQPGSLDDYEFEFVKTKAKSIIFTGSGGSIGAERSLSQLYHEDWRNMCNIARRYDVNCMAQDSDEDMIRLYPMLYTPGRPGVYYETIICPALPRMYLRADNEIDSDKKTKIFITFMETPADKYSYVLEIVQIAYPKNVTGEKDKALWVDHPFSTVDKEDQWNFCSAAQKYITEERGHDLNFIFAGNYDILNHPKVLLIPGQVKSPQAYVIERQDQASEIDFLIKCSEWPRMFLHRGQSEKEIKIILMKHELKNVPAR